MKKTVTTFAKAKASGEKLTMLTAYDYSTAKLMDEAGVDSILVGDSLGNVVLGYEDTVSVTMEDMIHHGAAVARGAKEALVVIDMPFMSYQTSVYDAVLNAGRLMKEGHAHGVKLEGGARVCPQIEAIVAADNNWGIGYQNRLLVSIPSDMKFFRQKTTGNVVVMGRKTLESFPNGLPLKNRVNIVLTKNKNYQVKDAVIVHSEEELLEELKKYPSEKIYVIGGESIYKMMLPYCDTVYVTKIDREFQADTYFPNLDQMDEWKMTEEGEEQTCFDLEFAFTKYERC